jgi:hypothetical protein
LAFYVHFCRVTVCQAFFVWNNEAVMRLCVVWAKQQQTSLCDGGFRLVLLLRKFTIRSEVDCIFSFFCFPWFWANRVNLCWLFLLPASSHLFCLSS